MADQIRVSAGLERSDRLSFVDDGRPVPSPADAAVPSADGLVVAAGESLLLNGPGVGLSHNGVHIEGELVIEDGVTLQVPEGDIVITGTITAPLGGRISCDGAGQRVLLTGTVTPNGPSESGFVLINCADVAIQGGTIEGYAVIIVNATASVTLGVGASIATLGGRTSESSRVQIEARNVTVAGSITSQRWRGGSTPSVWVQGDSVSIGGTTELLAAGADGWIYFSASDALLASGARLTAPEGQITAAVVSLVDEGAIIDDLDDMIGP